MDFDDQLADEVGTALPTEPRAVFNSLPGKAQGYGYLRGVQAQVLTAWHARRADRDVIVKVNTGGGKTIDGLIMLHTAHMVSRSWWMRRADTPSRRSIRWFARTAGFGPTTKNAPDCIAW